MSTDAYGNLRISQKKNIFNYITGDSLRYYSDQYEIGTNTIFLKEQHKWKIFLYDSLIETTHDYMPIFSDLTSHGLLTLGLTACPTTSEQYETLESKNIIEYNSGCSRTTKFSFIPYYTWDGNTSYNEYPIKSDDTTSLASIRYGLFNAEIDREDTDYNKKIPLNGIYLNFDFDNSQTVNVSWVLKYSYNLNDSLVDKSSSISQSSWNIDTFDGNGPSGKTINQASLLKNMCAIIDENYVDGRIRVGFIIEGATYYAHVFNYNDLDIFPIMNRKPVIEHNKFTANMSFNCQIYRNGIIQNSSNSPLFLFTGLYSVESSLEQITNIIPKNEFTINYGEIDIPSNDTEFILLSNRMGNTDSGDKSDLFYYSNVDITSLNIYLNDSLYASEIILELSIYMFYEHQILPGYISHTGKFTIPYGYESQDAYNNAKYSINNNINILEYWTLNNTTDGKPFITSQGKLIKKIYLSGTKKIVFNDSYINGILGENKISKHDHLIITVKVNSSNIISGNMKLRPTISYSLS
jgi:hypothetical protein